MTQFGGCGGEVAEEDGRLTRGFRWIGGAFDGVIHKAFKDGVRPLLTEDLNKEFAGADVAIDRRLLDRGIDRRAQGGGGEKNSVRHADLLDKLRHRRFEYQALGIQIGRGTAEDAVKLEIDGHGSAEDWAGRPAQPPVSITRWENALQGDDESQSLVRLRILVGLAGT